MLLLECPERIRSSSLQRAVSARRWVVLRLASLPGVRARAQRARRINWRGQTRKFDPAWARRAFFCEGARALAEGPGTGAKRRAGPSPLKSDQNVSRSVRGIEQPVVRLPPVVAGSSRS
jgi:hypothetical protein